MREGVRERERQMNKSCHRVPEKDSTRDRKREIDREG